MTTFPTTSDALPKAMSMGKTIDPAAPRTNREGLVKTSPDGRPTYSSGVVVAREDGGQAQDNFYAVIEPPKAPWPMGTVLRPEGKAWVTPYVVDGGNGRRAQQGLSFVVERLVPVSDKAPAAS